MADDKEMGFKVTDRRKFNPDGSLKDEVAQPAAPEAAPAPDNLVTFPGESERKKEKPVEPERVEPERPAPAPNPVGSQAAQAYQQANSSRPAPGNQPSFLNLVNMLATEGAMYLGLIESPVEGGVRIDLDAARELIDMLGMLEQKTAGNLTAEEAKMMEDVLAYLRMQYVSASKKR